MYVTDFPRLTLRHILNTSKPQDFFQTFYEKDVIYYYLGRGALWRAIKLLNLDRTDKVLVPSYHCGVEIESIIRADVGIEFYKVNEDMSVDLKSLEDRIEPSTKALLVIHYYGFAQEIESIRDLSREHRLFLIEDCAHALFSKHQGKPLGLFGDIAIFSQRKFLPLSDGGALLINNPYIESPIHIENPKKAVVWNGTLSLLLRFVKDRTNQSILFPLVKVKKQLNRFLPSNSESTYNTGMDFDTSMGRIGMSRISKRIMNNIHIADVIRKRHIHFQYLLDRLSDSDHIKVCFTSLPEGICPLFFPIRITVRQRRDVQNLLQQSGIQTFVFGENLHQNLPKEHFPEAETLSREILCLPIHQDLTAKGLDYIVDVINSIE